MKRLTKRLAALALTVATLLGLSASPLAAGASFTDVPESHWAHQTIMEMAEKGVMKGVGEGLFAPEGTVTAEMFIVLVGRVLFPDIQPQGDDWSGPYVEAFKENRYLVQTNITDETLKEPITRYDMAQIIWHTRKLIGIELYTNDSITYGDGVRAEDIDPRALRDLVEVEKVGENVGDFSEVPQQYQLAVSDAYEMELLRGDQNGNFNGGNTMTRMEAATVISRIMKRKEEAAAARKLRVELVTQELAAMLPNNPTQEELAEAMFQEERRWVLSLFATAWTTGFTEEEQETIQEELGLSSKLYRAARSDARNRVDLVERAEIQTKELSPESVADMMKAEDLAWRLDAYVNKLEPRDVKALMDKRGLTYADFEAIYRAADKEAWKISSWFPRMQMLEDAADVAVTAAKLAKAEGREEFTFHTFGVTMEKKAGTPTDFSKLHLGIFGEDGRLVGTPELDQNGRWEIELTLDTDYLDEAFTLKLLDTYEAYGYYLTPEMVKGPLVVDIPGHKAGTMKYLIYDGFTFDLADSQKR